MRQHVAFSPFRNSRVGRYQIQTTGNPSVLFGEHTSMMTLTKLTLAIFVIVQLLPSAVRTAQANDFPSQTLTPTVAEVGWTTVKLTDLVKNSASDCIVESRRLIRCAGRLRIDALKKTSVHGDGV